MNKAIVLLAALSAVAVSTVACSPDPKPPLPGDMPVVSSKVVDTQTSEATVVQPIVPGQPIVRPADPEAKAPDVVVQDQQTTTQTIETTKATKVVVGKNKRKAAN